MKNMRQDNVNALRREYDFSHGGRGKHHQCYRRTTIVALAATCATKVLIPSVTPGKDRQPVTQITRYDPDDLRDS